VGTGNGVIYLRVTVRPAVYVGLVKAALLAAARIGLLSPQKAMDWFWRAYQQTTRVCVEPVAVNTTLRVVLGNAAPAE